VKELISANWQISEIRLVFEAALSAISIYSLRKYGKIDPTSSPAKKPAQVPAEPESVLPIILQINEDFPFRANGEAGKQIEVDLFGKRVRHIHLQAASWLIQWADETSTTQSKFKEKFWSLNGKNFVEHADCASCGKASDSSESEDCVQFKGECGIAGVWSDSED